MAIRTVTVAGVTGAIGPTVINALCEAGFEVQALTRAASIENALHPKATIVEIDYSDKKRLQAALAGQDAVISALGDTASAVEAQEALIMASVATGVKRFVPSEFGSDTMNDRVRSFPFFADKIRHQELLKHAAMDTPGFTYSTIITGPFLDWGLTVVPLIINVGTRTADVFDGGDVPFSTTRVSTLAKALVTTLKHFEATANRTLYVHDAVITQNRLIECVQRVTGDAVFSTRQIDCEVLEEQAWNLFHDQSCDPASWIFSFINLSIWSSERLCAFQRSDNELLGIPVLEGSELDEVLEHEIAVALRAFASDNGAVTSLNCRTAAERAFEEGKRRLVGCRPTFGK